MMPLCFLVCLALPQEDRVRQLLEKLDDERAEARDEAERELVKIGEPALPHLRAAAGSPTLAELRVRAERAIREIEFRCELRKAYGDPRPITLQAAEMSLGQVLEEVGRQTGLTIDASAVERSSLVTISAKDAPLLKVLDDLCRSQTKRTYERQVDGTLRFLAARHPNGPAAYAGPFRIRLSRSNAVIEPAGRPRSVYVEFEGDCDRYPKPVGKLAVELTRGVDDQGTALGVKYGYHSATEIRARGSMTTSIAGTIVHPPPDPYEFTLSGLAADASKVTLRGEATFAIPLRPREMTFEKVERGQSKEAAGCVLFLDRLDHDVVVIRVHPAAGAQEPSLLELAGRVDPESLIAVDEKGTPHRASIPFAGTGQWSTAPSSQGAYFGAKFPSLAGQRIRNLRFRFGEAAWMKTVPFEIRDIPLP